MTDAVELLARVLAYDASEEDWADLDDVPAAQENWRQKARNLLPRLVAAEVAKEREACAVTVETISHERHVEGSFVDMVAAAIRARSEGGVSDEDAVEITPHPRQKP